MAEAPTAPSFAWVREASTVAASRPPPQRQQSLQELPSESAPILQEGRVQGCQGYLQKRTKILRRWKKQWFSIDPGKQAGADQTDMYIIRTRLYSAIMIQFCLLHGGVHAFA